MAAPFTEVTETLMDRFYSGVRPELTLGTIVVNAVGEHTRAAHLENMYAFWSSVMLAGSGYKDNPVRTHHIEAGVTRPLFGDWPDLFDVTAAAWFALEIADRLAYAGGRIADSLKLARFFRDHQPWPEDLRRCPAGFRA
jgi:hemoglobin